MPRPSILHLTSSALCAASVAARSTWRIRPSQACTGASTLLSSLCAATCRVRCSWSSAYMLGSLLKIMFAVLAEKPNLRFVQHDAPQQTSENLHYPQLGE